MENETNKNISSLRQRTHDGVDKVMDKAESISERSKIELANLKEKAIVMKESVDGFIRMNPEKSVLIAAGIGAVAGATVAAAMSRRKQ